MKRLVGFLSIFGVVVFWGISFISIKVVLEVVDPIVLGFLRYVLAVLFVLGFVLFKRISLRVPKRDLFIFFIAGVFGIFLYSALENVAMQYVSAETAAIMTSLVPLTIMIANRLVYKERFNIRYVVYAVCSIVGIILILLPSGTQDVLYPQQGLGVFLLFLSIVSWTGYAVVTKKVVEKYHTIKVTALQSMMALLAFFPALFFRPLPDVSMFQWHHLFHLLFLGIVCSGLTYLLFIHAIHRLGLSIPNIFLNFIPLVTTLVNGVILGVPIGLLSIIGGLIVILSMTLLTVDRMREAI